MNSVGRTPSRWRAARYWVLIISLTLVGLEILPRSTCGVVTSSDSTVMVPRSNTQNVGLRRVVAKKEIERVYDVLKDSAALFARPVVQHIQAIGARAANRDSTPDGHHWIAQPVV